MPSDERTEQPDSLTTSARRAFTDGLERNQADLYSFVRHLINDQEEARDIVQETFTDAWRATRRGQAPFTGECGDVEVRRWLFHVAYQRAISARRRRAVLAWQSIDTTDPREAPLSVEQARFEDRLADEDMIRRMLAQLEPHEAACIILKVAHAFTAPEIAQILNVSPVAARQRLSRALRRLRAIHIEQTHQELNARERPEEKIR